MRLRKVDGIGKMIIDGYMAEPYLTRGITIHRNHKGERLSIAPGSFLEWLYRDMSREIYVQKSTQSGISEYLIVRAFTRAERGRSVFYVLPTYELKNQFVKERVDKSLVYSEHYRKITKESDRRFAESMSLKQLKRGVIAFVGSNTTNAFLSFPADDVIIDELDRCNKNNIIMAPERQAASLDKTTLKVSNPTILNFGIDYDYKKSDKKKWMVKHECGGWIHPEFFEHVVEQIGDNEYIIRDNQYNRYTDRDILPICQYCGKPFNRYSAGEWIAEEPERSISGYKISKMFSSTVLMRELVETFNEALLSPTKLQRFYNADLGEAFNAAGAKITRETLEDCVDSEHMMPASSKGLCVMGIDVGERLHVRIDELLHDGRSLAVYIGAVRDYEDIVELVKAYRVRLFVVDGLPETRLSKKLVGSLPRGFMAFYGEVKDDVINPRKRMLTVDRTQALDAVKESYLLRQTILPANAREIPEFYDHMEASTRVYDEDRGKYVWVEGNNPDHFFHAEAYVKYARKLYLLLSKR